MLEEKLETLTKEIVALRQTLEANGGGAATTEKKTTGRKPAAKKAVEPEHDADETGTAMRKAAKKDKPAVQKYIKKQGCEDLAELLTKPELLDAAFDFAQGILDAPEEEEDDDDV
jgi:hypothetical protein